MKRSEHDYERKTIRAAIVAVGRGRINNPERSSARGLVPPRTPRARRAFLAFLGAIVASLAVCGAPAGGGAAQPEPTPDAAAILATIHARYDGLTTLRARFAQRYVHRLHQTEDRWSGRVALRRPSKLRLDYDTPRGRLVVSDGTTLYSYEPEPRPGQYYEQAVDWFSVPNVVGLMGGTQRLDADFDARVIDASSTGFAGAVLEVRPRIPSPLYERVLLYVDRTAARLGRIHRLMWIDAGGNTNRFDLTDQEENPAIGDPFFTWTPPGNAVRVEP